MPSQQAFSQETVPSENKESSVTSTVSINDVTGQSSSQIGEEELDTYLSAYSSKLVISARKYDPFGQAQDPSVKKEIAKTTKGPRRFKPIKPTSFSEVIGRIQVTTIMPGENKFLIGTRSFKKGDKFPIAYRNRSIDVEIIAVSAQKIDFSNTTTGEVASVELKLLPAGMQSGTSGIHAPGMELKDDNAPLRVGSNQ